jgi:hypothetical protein
MQITNMFIIIIITTTTHVVSHEIQLSLAKLWSKQVGSIPDTGWVFHSTPYTEQLWKLFSLTTHRPLSLGDRAQK